MSSKYKFGPEENLHFVTYSIVYWIDLFTRPVYKDIIINSLDYCCEHKGLRIFAWCIMSNHIHLIISTDGKNRPEAIMRDHKRHCSELIHKQLESFNGESRREWMLSLMKKAGLENKNNAGFQLWQQDNHPIMITDEAMLIQKLDYIHNNPVNAGFVDEAKAWLYSSAKNYAGEEGLLKRISLLEIGLRNK